MTSFTRYDVIHRHSHYCTLTAAIPEAEVGEPPDVAESYSEADQGQDKLKMAAPFCPALAVLKIQVFLCEI